MSIDLKNKHILITGSTDGLGKATAVSLAKLGAQIILHGKEKEKLETTVREVQKVSQHPVASVLCNLTDEKEILKQFSLIKKLDILINNAGIWYTGSTAAMPPE